MKLTYTALCVAALTLLMSCGGKEPEKTQIKTVKTAIVTGADSETTLRFPGKVKAAEDVDVAFRVSGTISRIAVTEGQYVKKGQLLAELDPTDYRVQLDATEAQYNQVKAEAERVIALYNEGGVAPNDYDKAVYGLKQITAKYNNHKDQLAYTKLYAPFSGYVQKKLFSAHETVAAGMPVIAIVGGGIPEVEINLPGADYIRRTDFSDYSANFSLYPGKTYRLHFISVTPKANANQLYTMRLGFEPNADPIPAVGLNATVTIDCGGESGHQIVVPAGALLNASDTLYIYRYNNGIVRREQVRLGRLLSDGKAVVEATEVTPGDTVVAAGVHHIADGERVQRVKDESKTNVGGLL